MKESTPLHWTTAYSITQDQPVLVPASFVYLPYYFESASESPSHNPISTGLACGSNLAPAIYKAILEVIERDAFMIMWQNQLPCTRIDLTTVDDPFIQSLLKELEVLPVECQAYLIAFRYWRSNGYDFAPECLRPNSPYRHRNVSRFKPPKSPHAGSGGSVFELRGNGPICHG